MDTLNRFAKYLFSMPAMAILLIIFAFSCAAATFIENDFGTETAWALVYAAWWFELVQVLLGANLVYNIVRFKLYKKDKLPALVFHVSFLFILLGSALTRYLGYEGTLHIRENESANVVVSSDSFIRAQAYLDGMLYGTDYKKFISRAGGNGFEFEVKVKDKIAVVKFKEFIPNAVSTIADDKDGEPMIALVVSKEQAKKVVMREGDEGETDGVVFGFNKKSDDEAKPFVRFILENGQFYIFSNQNIDWFEMASNKRGVYAKGEKQPFKSGQLYTIEGVNFTPEYIGLKGKEKIVTSEHAREGGHDALIVTLVYNDEAKDVALLGRGKGYRGYPEMVKIGDTLFSLSWGSTEIELPFAIKLDNFELQRYPGSNTPSSYASEITVEDRENNFTMPYRIYMNHVLDYRGYRFFQASYDQDEQGTILSVNKDPGKIPTYIGYFLLSLGLLWNLLNPKSRFRKLAFDIHKNMSAKDDLKSGDKAEQKRPKKSAKSAKNLAVLAIFTLCMFGAQDIKAQENVANATAPNVTIEEIVNTQRQVDPIEIIGKNRKGFKAHAELFSTLLTQSMDGRIYPVDTIAHEVLNKVHRGDSFDAMNAEEVLFSILTKPYGWQSKPIIKISHPELKKLLGISGSYASFDDLIDAKTDEYKLKQAVELAERKKDAEKNTFDKDVIKVDERLNILYSVFTWEILRIVPKANDANHRWYSVNEAVKVLSVEETDAVKMLFGIYFDAVDKAYESGNWTTADKIIPVIKEYQAKYGADVVPSNNKVKAEIFFNKAKIFDRIFPIYLLSGFILLVFIFLKMSSAKLDVVNKVVKVLFVVNLLTFIVHTAGLGLRWYVAEHAPWSNSYESMIYIAWAIALSGLFFSRTSIISMALASIMAGITLFTAHLSWMDPHITNLMPVLKSHWLTIHVSVITASYGFLGLCALLGFFTMILFIVRGFSKNRFEIERNITEATKINEMSMILGLSLLVVGNFLGGVWANESWGRYWGWDPKETWALISILIYAAVVHFRFIPLLNSQFAFAVASTIAYASIIMTYFGVNFYLSGMHSYAAGDPVPVPNFVYYTVAIVAAVIALAAFKRENPKKL